MIVITSNCTDIGKKQIALNQDNRLEREMDMFYDILPEVISRELDYHRTSEDSICLIMKDATGISNFSKSTIKEFLDSDYFNKKKNKKTLVHDLIKSFSNNEQVTFQEMVPDYDIVSDSNIKVRFKQKSSPF